ncbi:hypothetical protein WKW80_23570 [Variovorax humicola]|uniref:Uncharacterized protein n=1 Tax=Variovorax humicola TaxID=1769758 RepID=A0ABU8W4X5_9BURK
MPSNSPTFSRFPATAICPLSIAAGTDVFCGEGRAANRDAVGGQRDMAADRIARVQITDHEPSAMAPQEGGPEPLRLAWHEDPQRNRPTGSVDVFLDHPHDGRPATHGQCNHPPRLGELGNSRSQPPQASAKERCADYP